MTLRTIAAGLALTAGLFAADPPRFDVATLKQAPLPEGNYPITLGAINDGRLNLTNVTLNDCVKFAYDLVSDEQVSGPDWIRAKGTNLYDIVAVVPPNASHEQVIRMTQTLLAERLKLVVHHEQHEMKYLALTPGKDGPKMAPADPAQARNNSGGRGHITGNRASMGLVAMLLSRMEHQVVVDRTGLTGEYQIKLTWAPGSTGADAAPQETSDAPSLFAAVQEQLGLRLEARKGPLDIVVVDSAEKIPADN